MTWSRTHVWIKALLRDLLFCVAVALIFTFLGVYDSDNLAWHHRIVFWTVIMCLGALTFSIVEPLIFGRFLKNHHSVIQILTVALVISIPITVFLVGLNTQFEFDWSLTNWTMQFFGVLVISLIIVVARFLFPHFFGTKAKANFSTNISDRTTTHFLDRLPVKFRSAELLAVSSEGHYLRAHTDRGSTLILMRISDAIKELEDVDGLQVHRSWWVARSGIAERQRNKGRVFLLLKNDETAPVSRSFLAALKAANLNH